MSNGSARRSLRAGAAAVMAGALVFGAALPANAANGPNLVVDGGFEDAVIDLNDNLSTTAWSDNDRRNSALAVSTGDADSGTQFLAAISYLGAGPGSSYVINQDIPTVAGEMYFVSFATRSWQPAADVSATVQVHSGATTLQTLTVSPPTAGWATWSYTFFAAPGTTSTTISLLSETSTGYELAQFDSIVVQHVPIEDTPIIAPIVALAAAGVVVVVAAGTAVTVSRRRRLA